MITYYHKTKNEPNLSSLKAHKQGTWIYVQDPKPTELDQLIEQFDLDEGHVYDALDVDEVPRFETEGKQHYIFTRYAVTNATNQVETIPCLFIISKDQFITISLKPLPKMEKLTQMGEGFSTSQKTKLLLVILKSFVDRYEQLLTQTSRQIKTTRTRLRVDKINNKDFIEFVIIEDELNEFMSALSPMNAILHRLLTGKYIPLYDEDEDLIEDLVLANEQSLESCRSNIKTIVSIREAYSTIAANNLNQVIKLLTSVTVILTVPTIIASIYGMNVVLPLGSAQHGFSIIIGCMVAFCLALFILFKKNKWF